MNFCGQNDKNIMRGGILLIWAACHLLKESRKHKEAAGRQGWLEQPEVQD
jgi:hypothetical protein